MGSQAEAGRFNTDDITRSKSYPPDWSKGYYTGIYRQKAEKAEADGRPAVTINALKKLHHDNTGWDGVEFTAMTSRQRSYANGEIKNTLDLPPELHWLAEDTLQQLRSNDTRYVYHGTRLSRLQGMADSGGLIAFKEGTTGSEIPSVFGCATAIEAGHHAFTRGPEDFNSSDQFISSPPKDDPVVNIPFFFEVD